MGVTDLHGIEATGVHKILCLLEALRHSPTGAVIYRQVERMLEDVLSSQKDTEQIYITLINQLLDAYLSHLREGSPLQVQIRLLQARLQPPLPAGDLEMLRDYIELYATQISALRQMDSGVFQAAIQPLLASFGIIEPARDVAAEIPVAEPPEPEAQVVQPVIEPEPEPEPEQPEPEPEPEVAATDETRPDTEPATDVETEQDEQPSAPEQQDADDEKAESRVDTAYRSHLDSKRRDIQKLQSTLAEQILGTIAQNQEFGVLLEVVLGELRQAGEGKELEDLRWTLIREIEKLTKGHHELAEKLDSTHHYLQIIESDSRQLSDELTRVRLLSLTDELTGLPNRRAFLRRIEDEVARVQRYGFPLSLALIDLDHFKQVNDKYGHAGGDEVLQMYSRSILSIFRHHDLVARYGGEEFAVLLPNTDEEGSQRALTKVRGRAQETRWQANGEMIPVPTFSAGVSLYKPGETASAFIERADKALYRAKRLGRNRVEMDATYQSEADSEPQPPGNDARRRGET
ncbi:MAG TPA: GGDEF domain-containing protein [Gammaproteobacteria bacterium]|nr:GGDEF domain-containing protein [Gammaproteobacteria bacterium]